MNKANEAIEIQRHRNLLCAILQQAMHDVVDMQKKYKSKERIRDSRYWGNKAKVWLLSDSKEEHSFLWLCDLLDLSPDKIRQKVCLD